VSPTLLAWACAFAVVLLIAAYGIGAPFLLLRTALILSRRRRLRYRAVADEVLATSRFTIPVSILFPLTVETPSAVNDVARLLDLRYPETEVIVVTAGAADTLSALRAHYDLRPCELFFRRAVPASEVRAIYRSQTEPRLLVADQAPGGEGDALNCAVNLARYRYVCAADPATAYDRDSLLEAMQAALEDPSLVVGVTTGLAVKPVESVQAALTGQAPVGIAAAIAYLAAARTGLLTVARRRLDLPPGGCPGFALWRRDSLIEVGGFERSSPAVHADLTFRMHCHYRGDRRRYRIIHVTTPVGTVSPDEARHRMIGPGYVPLSVLWRHRGMTFNPALGRLGLLDFPRYLFNVVLAPWIELAALILLAASVPLDVLSVGELLLVLFVIGLGSGVVATSALLLASRPAEAIRPAALFNLVLVGPFEYFLTRPSLLVSRIRRAPQEH
jgi:cellulose synthase/poly-beta-1,6-N-acetylglucosamine synthase-like glycosyltransferase